MNKQKAWADFYDAMQILKTNIRLFHEGDISAYKTITVQLRTLLCKTRTNSPLLPRVAEQVKFHPMWSYLGKELNEGLVFQLPAMVSPPEETGPETARLFDETKLCIELEEWLDQPFISSELTIRKLITSVAGEEAAHSDPNYGEELKLLKSIPLVDNPAHIKGIIVIGEYILRQIKTALEDNTSESSES